MHSFPHMKQCRGHENNAVLSKTMEAAEIGIEEEAIHKFS